ncbi:MAG: hypothetical protein ABSG68_04190 [Thermoguttaceae bacterium]|jgi:hypothetical protein
MRCCQVYATMIGAALVLLVGSSASEAGWFRGGHAYYYYPASSTCHAATNPAPTAAAQTVAPAPSGPVVYQTYKPVTGVEAVPATPPAATYDAPGTMSGGGWSVAPRTSWEFGRYPPFR